MMSELPITGFDMAVIGVLLVSGIIAFARGFMREILSIAAFIVAALAALWSFPTLKDAARNAINPSYLADFLVIVGVFMAVYVAVTMVTGSISSLMQRSDRVGFFDRTLGFGFGLARGLLLAAIGLILYNVVTPPAEDDEWLTEAMTYPLVSQAADAIQQALPTVLRTAAQQIPLDPPEGG